MKKNSKSNGVMCSPDSYKPKSSMMLEGLHAEALSKHPLGKKIKITVHGHKKSHSINHDKSHSANFEIDSIGDDEKSEGKD